MAEKRTVTFQGNELTLAGAPVDKGDSAPGFTVLANDMSEKGLDDYRGKVVVLSAVPSLDTPVCDKETKRFNDEAEKLGDDIAVLTVSMDLPFAQARWAEANQVSNVELLSDHRDASFGDAYGVLIEELRLLARVVFIVDRDGKIAYRQVVPEITEEPDYDDVLAALKSLA